MSDQSCVHITAIASVKHAKKRVCDECVKIGSSWGAPADLPGDPAAPIAATTRPTVTRRNTPRRHHTR